MFRLLSFLAGLMALGMILFGTWPIVLGKPRVKPLVKPSTVEQIADDLGDRLKDIELE